MLKLATILDNPGEPRAETRYRELQELRQLGYNGLVLYATTGLSGVDSVESVGPGEMRTWVAQRFDFVQQRIEEARAAGLEVYLTYDVLSLARPVVERRAESFSCRHQPQTLCPASDAALAASTDALRGLLARVGQVSGIVLRFGDNDAIRLPYLIGNDLYQPHCPRCSQLGPADRICRIVDAFHRLVVQERCLRLIIRAWNVRPGGLHDSVDLCQRVHPRLPTDPRLILSFKFTQTDFWRFQRWNPSSLVFGDCPIIYELECQREYEGKGAIPNWQAPLWRNGGREIECDSEVGGLAKVARQVNLAGLWAWVRGGGWGGPFVSNETWIDANAFAVPQLADDPEVDLSDLARRWITQRLKISDADLVEVLMEILSHSPQVTLLGFYLGPLARGKTDPWHPNADWIQDDLLDAVAAWRIVQRLPETGLDEVVREKREAVERTRQDRVALRRELSDTNRSIVEPLLHTLDYAQALFSALLDLLAGLIAYRRYQAHESQAESQLCRDHLLSAQTHWNHHTQRTASLHGAATAFREVGFWELTEKILNELASEES